MVAQDANVKLPAIDILFGNHVVVVLLVNELHAFFELFITLHKGGLRNPEGSFLLKRFYQDGKPQWLGTGNSFASGDGHEVRDVNPMVSEDLFRDALVFAKRQAGRAASRERQAVHLQKGDDILVTRPVVVELVGEIENDVGIEPLQLLSQQVEVVENGQMLRGMT